MQDKLDQEILVGAYIVYGHALGRSAGLKIGKVLGVSEVPVTHSSRPPHRIKVVGVEEVFWKEGLRLGKVGTLQFPDRVVVIAPELVPERFRVLLDGYSE